MSDSPEKAEQIRYTFDYDGENFTMKLEGHELVGCQWIPPDGVVKYVVIFFHGLGAFLAINRSFFPAILADGGAVFGTDHLGHGRSPGDRGNNSSEMLHKELTLLISRATVIFPGVPIFLYGHSMGGVSVISYILTHLHESRYISGVIVECPWLADRDELESSIILKLLGLCGKFIFPSLILDTGDGISKTGYPQQFIDKFLESHLPHDFITPRLYASSIEMRKISWNKCSDWPSDLPLLIMHGGHDQSLGVKKCLKWAENMADMYPSLVRIIYHEDAEHAMLRGSCGPIVLEEIIDFVGSCLKEARKP